MRTSAAEPHPPRRFRVTTEQYMRSAAAAAEPYPPLHGGAFGPSIAESPDPLASYRWDFTKLAAPLSYQVIHNRPTSALGDPPSSFANLSALSSGDGGAIIRGPGLLTLRFGSEAASWLEIEGDEEIGRLRVGISENRLQAPLEAGTSDEPWAFEAGGPDRPFPAALSPALEQAGTAHQQV